MFCGMPQTVEDAIELMRAEPDASFIRIRFKDELLIAVRAEDGSLSSYKCRVLDEAASPPDDRGSDPGEGA